MICLVKRMTQNTIGLRTMCSSESYEEAIRTLNKLQSNAAYIRAVRKHNSGTNTSIEDTKKYLLRSGLTLDELDSLRIIHVAGTKGKGSTCAFTESILRNHGFQTGFYSSPHLISVRERFRINGQPISKSTFTHFFWKCYHVLDREKDHDCDMPQYFKFLTVMMFHVFLKAKVDVAIVEVGIGGEHDCTNIIKNPICTGITSLGLDHTSLLGETIEEITFQKSGIFKSNSPAFTVPQPINVMNCLEKRANERNCSLTTVPNVENYKWPNGLPKWKISQNIHNYNISLAIQLATTWIELTQTDELTINQNLYRKTKLLTKEKKLSLEKTEIAISKCKWPGRTQILQGKNMDFFIDGAHTLESMECCVNWFNAKAGKKSAKRFLIFNSTGDRDPAILLNLLKPLNFDKCFFTPNISGVANILDQENFTTGTIEQKNRCEKHLHIWKTNGLIVENLNEAFESIRGICHKNLETQRAQILITGSLHLVGAALSILDPNFEMTTKF